MTNDDRSTAGRLVSIVPVASALVICIVAGAGRIAHAQMSSVAGTIHNLSVTGPGEFRSLTETEVCKFCHIPHNAVAPEALWGHALSRVTQYEVPSIRRGATKVQAPQPDGSSRLCLSCHDGTVALGDVGGTKIAIPTAGTQRLTRGRPGFIGTDLSGSHPISIVVPVGGSEAGEDADMGLNPRSLVKVDSDIRLDDNGKMQCTTCHDPHRDVFFNEGTVPHFWVKPTVDEVCLACHAPR